MIAKKSATRIRRVMLAEEVPQHSNGGPKLCHLCQWQIREANGFIRFLAEKTITEARRARARAVALWKPTV